MKPKVLISANTAWNIYNFRRGIVNELISNGYEVVAVAPHDKYVERLVEIGCRFTNVKIDRSGLNPLRDLLLIGRYIKIMFLERPCVFLGYTIKPNVYGSIAATALGVPVINNISGLGTAFLRGGWLMQIAILLYRLALRRSTKVFFQNKYDCAEFLKLGIIHPCVAEVLPGSGVDLKRHSVSVPPERDSLRFLFVGRILWDKGVGEIVDAARVLKDRGLKFEVCLLGSLDVNNPSAVTRKNLDEWVNEGIIKYLGSSDDVRGAISESDCVVLPSYREGTPRCLLEAAALGRPVITSDAVGCLDVVEDGVTGYIAKVRDPIDLADKMQKFISLLYSERVVMGYHGRAKMELEYDERTVVEKYKIAVSAL